jgi:hypothetical protein
MMRERGIYQVNKPSIKIIKRTNVKQVSSGSNGSSVSASSAASNRGKAERRSQRAVAETVSKWVAMRRESRTAEESLAIRRLFGSKPLLSKTA